MAFDNKNDMTEIKEKIKGRSRGQLKARMAKKASADKKEVSDDDISDDDDSKLKKAPGKGKRIAILAGAVTVAVLAAAGGLYIGMAQKYKTVFFPNTWINDMDMSGLTIEQVKEHIASGIDGYTLTLEERGGFEESISGEEIGLHPEFDGTLEQILAAQEPLAWGGRLNSADSYRIDTMMAYDQEKLAETVNGLGCLSEERMEAPKDAYLSDYIAGSGYQIVPEEAGSTPDAEKVLKVVSEAILGLKSRIVLDELDVYQKAQVTADSPELQNQAASWNRYVNTTVTYRFGSKSEVLDGNTIHTWLTDNGHGGPLLDEEKVAEYVAALARDYNTAYKPKQLKTSYGPTVTITGGNYGWRINQSAETAALTQILHSGESQEREPVYSQTAASHDGNDYGDTYVEINLTAQHLYYYKDGKLLVESDFVSGNESRGWSTPAGAYPLTYKQRNATLKGEGYATPVSYWMPFNGGIGMHDAGWRGSFGGKIYKTSGSHGCINMPPSAAKTVYENISSGMPVLCYHLSGTEKGSSLAPQPETTAPQPETTAPAVQPTVAPEETLPPESIPESTPAESAANPQTPAEGGGTPSQPETPAQPGTSPQPGTLPQPGVSPQPETTAPPVQETPGPAGTDASSGMADGPGGRAERGDSGVVEGPGM